MQNNDSKQIKKYERYTAGRIMTKNVPVVEIGTKIGDIENLLVRKSANYDTINYIYVVSKRGLLKGVISIKEIFRQHKDTLVDKVMKTDLIIARAATDQERVAYRALKNNIKAVPIVDKKGVFLGLVQSDSILNTLHEEFEEDVLHLAGINNPGGFDNIMEMSAFTSLRHRFPWLFLGLLGGMLIAQIIGLFEKTLASNIVIATFIPLMSYMASAVGAQMSTLIIRDLALYAEISFLKYFLKQSAVVSMMAFLSSLTMFVINYIMFDDLKTGFALSLAMFITILSSLSTGLLVPISLKKIGLDPANASGPIATIMQDTTTILIYFGIVSVILA